MASSAAVASLCRAHGVAEHDVFISYRVEAHRDEAAQLADALAGAHVTAFLDKRCLNVGEPWAEGFQRALRDARAVVLLVSEDTLAGIRRAHEQPDSVLLEYELALDRSPPMPVLPILLGCDGVGFSKSSFDLSQFSDQPHVHPQSSRASVRETMRRVFRLQGLQVADLKDAVALQALLAQLREAVPSMRAEILLREAYTADNFKRVQLLDADRAAVVSLEDIFTNIAIVHRDQLRGSLPQATPVNHHSQEEAADDPTHEDSVEASREAQLQQYDEIHAAKTPVALLEVFGKDQEHGRLLVLGKPGVGKTTLLKKIAHDWAKGALFPQFTWVLLVTLRDPALTDLAAANPQLTLPQLVHAYNFGGDRGVPLQAVEDFLASHGSKVLFLLDGYDEFQDRVPVLKHLVAGSPLVGSFLGCRLLLTSRPSAASVLLDQAAVPFAQHLEVLGFSTEAIDEFIGKYFTVYTAKAEAVPASGEELARSLQAYLREDIALRGLAHVPIMAVILCSLWAGNPGRLANTLTGIFQQLKEDLMAKAARQTGAPKQTQDAAFAFLGRLAWAGLQQQPTKLVFTDEDIDQLAPEAADSVRLAAVSLGLLNKDESVDARGRRHTVYFFLHLTLQEFAAASHLVATGALKSGQWHFTKALGGTKVPAFDPQPRYDVVWMFCCGLLGPASKDLLQQIVSKAKKHAYRRFVIVALQCQSESRCQELMKLLEPIFRDGSVDLQGAELDVGQWAALASALQAHDVKQLDIRGIALDGRAADALLPGVVRAVSLTLSMDPHASGQLVSAAAKLGGSALLAALKLAVVCGGSLELRGCRLGLAQLKNLTSAFQGQGPGFLGIWQVLFDDHEVPVEKLPEYTMVETLWPLLLRPPGLWTTEAFDLGKQPRTPWTVELLAKRLVQSPERDAAEQTLWWLIRQSKTEHTAGLDGAQVDLIRHAASNAISVLNRACIPMSVKAHQEPRFFRGIQVPRADLRMAEFYGVDLRGADLSHCTLVGAKLRGADLSGCRMTNVAFVEYTSLKFDTNVRGVVLSNDGTQMAVACGMEVHLLRKAADSAWEWNRGATLRGHTSTVYGVAFSPDGKQVVSGSGDKTARLWDTASGRPGAILEGHTGWVMSAAFSPDGKQVVSGSDDKTMRLWDAASSRPGAILQGHTSLVRSVAFSPDGKQIVSGSDDNMVRLWDAASGRPGAILQGHTGAVYSVTFSPDGKQVVSGSQDRSVRLWDAASGRPGAILQGHTSLVSGVAFSPDGKQLVSGSHDKTVRLWDAASGRPGAILQGHTDLVRSVAFSPNGEQILSGSLDKVRLWDAASGRPDILRPGHTGPVNSVAFSPDGKRIASGSEDKTVRLWDAHSGRPGAILQGHTGFVDCVAWSPDGKQIVSGSDDKTVRLWDATSGRPGAILQGHTSYIKCVAWSPEGKQVASGSHDNTVRLWDAASGRPGAILQGHTGFVTSVAFSPDGRQIVSGSDDNTVRLWDAASGRPGAILQGHTGTVYSMAFSPDGKQIVSGSSDRSVRLWDAASGQASGLLQGHKGWVTSVAFSPDGKQVVSGSDDGTVRLWDAASRRPDTLLQSHGDTVKGVAFSPDGKQVVSGSSDGTVRVWDRQADTRGSPADWQPLWLMPFTNEVDLRGSAWQNAVELPAVFQALFARHAA